MKFMRHVKREAQAIISLGTSGVEQKTFASAGDRSPVAGRPAYRQIQHGLTYPSSDCKLC
jgi:hypothetical protein